MSWEADDAAGRQGGADHRRIARIGAEIAKQLSAEGRRHLPGRARQRRHVQNVVRQCREQAACSQVKYGNFDFLEEARPPAVRAANGGLRPDRRSGEQRRHPGAAAVSASFRPESSIRSFAVNLRAPFC
jgi:hypothetical protein